ncbi:MAG: MFS transporter, partial [Mycobacteriaceae bacterium]|nr:MFS transporter [Mycobacteriaceae bacterium]
AHAADVQKAQVDSPKQWKNWWWICLGAQIAFLPFIFLMAGHWSPKKAAAAAAEHDKRVQEELATLT